MIFSWLLIVIAAVMWGIDGVILTPKYFEFGLYNVIFIVFLAHVIPFIVLHIKNHNKIIKINKLGNENIKYLLLVSIFGGTIGTFSIVKALMLSEFNPYSIVILIQKSQPIFAILSAYILLNEKITKKFFYVFIITIISLYFLTFGLNNPFLTKLNKIYPMIYSLLAAISFGVSTTFSRKIALNLDSKNSVYYRFMMTSIFSFIILLFHFNNTINSFIYILNNKNILILTLIISIWGLISSKLYYIGLKNTKAIYSTISELAFPLTSVLLDSVIYGNSLEVIRILAAIILTTSILYLNFSNKN